jgi:hypothetical protein
MAGKSITQRDLFETTTCPYCGDEVFVHSQHREDCYRKQATRRWTPALWGTLAPGDILDIGSLTKVT